MQIYHALITHPCLFTLSKFGLPYQIYLAWPWVLSPWPIYQSYHLLEHFMISIILGLQTLQKSWWSGAILSYIVCFYIGRPSRKFRLSMWNTESELAIHLYHRNLFTQCMYRMHKLPRIVFITSCHCMLLLCCLPSILTCRKLVLNSSCNAVSGLYVLFLANLFYISVWFILV